MLPTRKSKIRTLSGSQDERTRPEDERADSYEEQEEGEEGQDKKELPLRGRSQCSFSLTL